MNQRQLASSTAVDRIKDHYQNNTQLSLADQIIKDRLIVAHTLICTEGQTDRSTSRTLMDRFQVSHTTSYSDILWAKNLFGEMHTASKEAMRYIASQWATDLYRKGRLTNNLRAMEKGIERYTKVNCLDKDDPDYPDPSKIQPPIQLISIDFDFLKHPMFKLMDETTQNKLLEQYAQFMAQLKLSPISEYSDMFLIEDISHEIID